MTPEQRFDIVLYRLNSAKSLLDEIKDHIERGYYNTAMNRMYYACFYAVSGLLLQSEIDGVKSHEGVRQKFSQHFGLFHSLSIHTKTVLFQRFCRQQLTQCITVHIDPFSHFPLLFCS